TQVHRRTQDRVAKVDGELSFHVGATLRPLFELHAAAEEIGKDVGESRRPPRPPPAPPPPAGARELLGELREVEAALAERIAAAEGLAPEAVVLLALLLVAQNGVGLGDLLELVLRFLVPLVLVGVVLLGEVAIRLLDLFVSSVFLDPEDVIVVLLGHGRGKYREVGG